MGSLSACCTVEPSAMLSAIATGMRTSVRVAETRIAAEPKRFPPSLRTPMPVAPPGPAVRTAGGHGLGQAPRAGRPAFREARGCPFSARPDARSVHIEMTDQGEAPDLQTQLESLLHHVWAEEARWRCAERELREEDDETGWHVL